MILNFDKGTLTLSGVQESMQALIPSGFKWDERTNNFRAPAFQYRRIHEHLDRSNTTIVDQVFEVGCDATISIHPWRDTSLFPYQAMACDAWEQIGAKGVIVLPTGGGKTRVAAELIRRRSTSTLVLVPTRALLQQWQTALAEFSDSEIGLIGDGSYNLKSLTICTFESAYRRMAQLGNKFRLLIVDETHHFGRGMRDEILVMSSATQRLGLTASLPTDKDHLDGLTKLMGPLVFERGINDLRGEYLSDFDHFRIPVQLTTQELLEYNASYSYYQQFTRETKWCWQELGWQAFSAYAMQSERGRKALASARRARSIASLCKQKMVLLRKLLANHWRQRVFAFVANTQDACDIARQFLAYPITAAISKSEREVVLKKFQEGTIRALVACKVLNEGIDVPSAEVAIILGGTGNPREHIQRVGRVLRKTPEKRAAIYELVAENTFEVRKSDRRNRT